MIRTLTARMRPSRWFPGVVTHEHGRGRVVYLAGGLDAAYYLYAYPYQRLALEHAVRWAAASPPPVAVEAPMCVHTKYAATEDGQRLVVHLFNDLNTTAHHALPGDDVPLREETVPVHDIGVRFASVIDSRVSLEPGGRNCASTGSPRARACVPRLDVHAMVVASCGIAGVKRSADPDDARRRGADCSDLMPECRPWPLGSALSGDR